MSILIKGIDLPKDRDFILLKVFSDGKTRIGLSMNYTQAIQIPTPHGRLIDGDEFKSWVDDWYDCTDIGNIVESWIDERPTILEAEE